MINCFKICPKNKDCCPIYNVALYVLGVDTYYFFLHTAHGIMFDMRRNTVFLESKSKL